METGELLMVWRSGSVITTLLVSSHGTHVQHVHVVVTSKQYAVLSSSNTTSSTVYRDYSMQ